MMVRAEIVNQDRPIINPARIESSRGLRQALVEASQLVKEVKTMNCHIRR